MGLAISKCAGKRRQQHKQALGPAGEGEGPRPDPEGVDGAGRAGGEPVPTSALLLRRRARKSHLSFGNQSKFSPHLRLRRMNSQRILGISVVNLLVPLIYKRGRVQGGSGEPRSCSLGAFFLARSLRALLPSYFSWMPRKTLPDKEKSSNLILNVC